jgi:hypothetical protein
MIGSNWLKIAGAAGLALILLVLKLNAQDRDSSIPVVPVGDDAYLKWEDLPRQRIGVRAYMRSTYDRTGGNRDADASHFLYQQADDFNVTLDTAGPGVLFFVRTNHHHVAATWPELSSGLIV